MDKHIIAIGGGGFGRSISSCLIEQYILSLSNKDSPRICFIPTATGDDNSYIVRFYSVFTHLNCIPTHIEFFKRTIDINDHIMKQDIVFVYMSGSKPITDFLGEQVAFKEDGGVLVDDFMSTTVEGVWAIGDIRNTPFKQAVVAASDGCIAAMAIDRYLNSRKSIRVDWVHA